ncbi:hypothetical protein L7F22_017430 [Adiantum nelumboides]|nr:hypothetical protein [Adiantum nelumboides]
MAFMQRFGARETSEKLWERICELRLVNVFEYGEYELQFTDLWDKWISTLTIGERAPEFYKTDCFVAGLCPPLKDKVKARFPVTFEATRDVACHIGEAQVTLLGHVVFAKGVEADPGKIHALTTLASLTSAKELVSFIQKVRYLSRFIHLLSQVVFPLQQLTHSNTFSWSEKNEQQFSEAKEILSSLPTIAPPKWGETFYVNPSVGGDSIGVVLMKKYDSCMHPIYFINRVMTIAEKDYTAMEHVVMALMFAVGKFRSYFLPKKFIILTLEEKFPLVLQLLDVSTRISKWLVHLQEFEYIVQVESSTRASLSGLLTHRCYEKKLKVKSAMVKVEEKASKFSEAHSLYFDGTYKRKVDKATVGVVIYDKESTKVFCKGLMLENVHSNNEAEYAALSLGLEWCLNIGVKRLNAFGDVLLLVKKVHGTWACRNQGLVVQLHRVKELLKRFEVAHLLHVPRKDNQEADALAREQLQEVTVGAIALQQPQF